MALTTRFRLVLVVLLAAIALVATAGNLGLSRLNAELRAAVEVDVQRLLHVTHARRLFRSMLVLEREALLEPKKRGDIVQKIHAARKELVEKFDAYAAVAPPEDAPAVRDLRDAYARWVAVDDEVLRLADADLASASRKSQEHARDPVSWEKVIGSLVTLSEQRFDARKATAQRTYVVAQRVVYGASLAAALFGVGLGLVVLRGIRANVRRIVDMNTELEKTVAQRTAKLAKREADVRLILDNTGDALFTVGLDGKMADERSRAAIEWLGDELPASRRASDYLFPDDETKRKSFDMGLADLVEDAMPVELLLDQMPASFSREGRDYRIAYRFIAAAVHTESRLLVVIGDVTEQLKAERDAREARDLQHLLTLVVRDPNGYAIFAREVRGLLDRLATESDLLTIMRCLHTLKGNAHSFGLTMAAEQCHDLESYVEAASELPAAMLAQVREPLLRALEGAEAFTSFKEGTLAVSVDRYQALRQQLRQRGPHSRILAAVEAWRLEPTKPTLERLARQAERIASSLGMQVEVEIDDGNVVLPPGEYDRMWSALVHVLRNAIVHGIEPEYSRASLGKPAVGKLTLRTTVGEGDRFAIEITDDGRGIDYEALRRKAERQGLEAESDEALLKLVFEGRLSTVDDANDIAGRGVGVSAAREECQLLEGRMHVRSQAGQGTSFRFSFPPPAMTPS